MREEKRAVAPVRPAAAYIGGKRRLGELLARRIEAIQHDTYAEPFIGMGGVFFRRRWAPRREVINDVSRDVVTLFRILQRHYPQFLETLKFQVTSRAEFERLAAANSDTLTDLERAARFLYLQRLAFGGKVAGRNFGVEPTGSARFDVTKLGPLLEAIHERLGGVVIECLSWADFIARYDGPGTLFYLDPPYWGCEADYGAGVFSRDDFARLAQRLGGIAGKFMLSVNDVPETREVFADYAIEAVTTRYTISGQWSDVAEILVTGPSPDRFATAPDLLSLV
ncbi:MULTISPECIES: DNA adenine methylase [unclassified Bradyrhizobium]|uniref:DNA adenine methylase n=1 Tax=unclassified Bradyrhizobium TaxID=2631580 RepID=UPI002916883A|nr:MULTISPECIES: DNA adenine methylase [unclassified Bradyrhizobium]